MSIGSHPGSLSPGLNNVTRKHASRTSFELAHGHHSRKTFHTVVAVRFLASNRAIPASSSVPRSSAS